MMTASLAVRTSWMDDWRINQLSKAKLSSTASAKKMSTRLMHANERKWVSRRLSLPAHNENSDYLFSKLALKSHLNLVHARFFLFIGVSLEVKKTGNGVRTRCLSDSIFYLLHVRCGACLFRYWICWSLWIESPESSKTCVLKAICTINKNRAAIKLTIKIVSILSALSLRNFKTLYSNVFL